MDVRAILLIGGSRDDRQGGSERIAGRPIALLDALGRPVVHHVIERLREFGIRNVCVVSDSVEEAPRAERDARRQDITWVESEPEHFWRSAENAFADCTHNGAELVLLFRLGAYAEIDFDDLLQFHLDQRARVTQVHDAHGALDIFAISASRRNDSAYLLRHELKHFRTPASVYEFKGYCNRLETPSDLRRLAADGLMRRIQLAPSGRELKPGVWVGEGVRIDKGTRLVAPVYIGERARIRAGALLTRCSSVEHHAEVDCGTVIEAATVLPYAYVGPGLDVTHSVVGFSQIQNLKRRVLVEISDPKLVGEVPQSVSWRAMRQAAGLAAFLPMQFLRGLRGKKPSADELAVAAGATCATDIDGAFGVNVPKEADKNSTFVDFAVMRRYGNQ